MSTCIAQISRTPKCKDIQSHGPHLINLIVVMMKLIVWNWIHLGVRFYSHFATLASKFQPEYNNWARDRYSKYDERRKDMAQLQSPSRASSGPCPLFCPILISSHIIRHLGVNASLQPPSNCHVEVPLHVSSDYQISSIIQFSPENWILLKIGWFHKHIMLTCSGLAVGSWNAVAPLNKSLLLLYAPSGRYKPKLPLDPGPSITKEFRMYVLQMDRKISWYMMGSPHLFYIPIQYLLRHPFHYKVIIYDLFG